MTKREIYNLEQSNDGRVYLYPEGLFYKAYEQSAFLLCTRVHPFKVSAREMKGLDEPLVSVGFPMTSLEKFTRGLQVVDVGDPSGGTGGIVILHFPDGPADLGGYPEWKSTFRPSPQTSPPPAYNSLPVYGLTWRLTVEVTQMCARLERNYRYSLGEDIRKGAKEILVCIALAGKDVERVRNIQAARRQMLDLQLSLRLLNELKVLTDKRYVAYLEITEDISRQLSNWERRELQRLPAGVSPP